MEILKYDVIDSTSTEARRLIENGRIKDVTLLMANSQTLGRGRHGNSFYSPGDTGLYMTLVLPNMGRIASQVTLTSRSAVAVREGILKITGADCRIKWVNDLYLNGRKVCGILCEAVNDYEKDNIDFVLVGVGINLTTSDFPDEIRDRAGSLFDSAEAVRDIRDELAKKIACELIGELKSGDGSWYSKYVAASMVLGREITYTEGNDIRTATAERIGENGELIVKDAYGNLHELNSGEISLRVIENNPQK